MKKKIIIEIIIVVTAIIGIAGIISSNVKLHRQLSAAENNNKTLLMIKDSVYNSNRTLKLTIDQLDYLNDSISDKLKSVIKENKIKEKKIKQLEYLETQSTKIDTLTLTDTIFVNDLYLDTLLQKDRWYSLKLKLRAPNTIIVEPTFNNEYITVFSYRKETVRPPKKCCIARWFQKKHIVTETFIVSKNPYAKVKMSRVVEIIKL